MGRVGANPVAILRRPAMLAATCAWIVSACSPGADDASASGPADDTSSSEPSVDTATSPPEPNPVYPQSVVELSTVAHFDPVEGGERTRAMVVADFDNDGRDDLFVGNPGDRSYVLRNTSSVGQPSFETAQVLSEGHISWTAAAADFDNDGDVDLMVGGGGNECTDVDQLWRNELVETGTLHFVDVRLDMGLTHGPQQEELDQYPTSGVRWLDVNLDGFLDLYIAHNATPRCGDLETPEVNELWLNVDGERFEHITQAAGLGGVQGSTRHPSILDYDNDGDPDIFDANLHGPNAFYRNMFAETGEVVFGKVDLGASGADGLYPERAFASCAADFNNDGWEDLLVLNRAVSECIVATDDTTAATTTSSLEGSYHGVLINHGAGGFDDRTQDAGIRVQVANLDNGVMGCQVGDLNADGVEDVFVGNGGPRGPAKDDLWLGTVGSAEYIDASRSIRTWSDDSEALRTHGTVVFDVDGDHKPELVVGNGGPSALDDVEEPNRIFHFEWLHEAEFLAVRVVGDGDRVNRDAIGARVRLDFELPDGSVRSLHRTQRGGNCFSADTGRVLYFGLNTGTSGLPAGRPTQVVVSWPDGTTTTHPVPEGDASRAMEITYTP